MPRITEDQTPFRRRPRVFPLHWVVLCCAGSFALSSNAQMDDFNGISSVVSGSFHDPATWDCTCVPSLNDSVHIGHPIWVTEDIQTGTTIISEEGVLISAFDEWNWLTSGSLHGTGGAMLMPHDNNVTLISAASAQEQHVFGTLSVANWNVLDSASALIHGSLTINGHAQVNSATVIIEPDGQLILSENEHGRATILRSNGGVVEGKVTREIFLAAAPNRDMSLVEQRITTGLEGVTAADFVGDIPTWGFDGADDPSGFSSIAYWTAAATWNYAAVGDINDTLPVFGGIYLALPATESYTLTFSGTLPANEVTLDIPQTAFNVLVGNATNANASLNAIDAQFGDNNTSFRCWNTRTLQYDQYIDGLSTNGLSATLQPNTTCEFAPSGVPELTMALNEGMPKGVLAPAPTDVDGAIRLSASTASGFRDECLLVFREGTTTNFLVTEDALNSASLYSACDLSFRDVHGNRSAISQLDFADEPQTQLDVVLAANRPIDGTYTIVVEEMNWPDGSAFITLEGDTTAYALEEGYLTTIELDGNSNNTHTIGSLNCQLSCSDVNANDICDGLEATGCSYPNATNFDPEATIDDHSCTFTCPADINNTGLVDTSDLLAFLVFFGTECP
ncbi:MAG: hypothetical protein ACPF87_05805 [Flavobacteriales bacterium]